MADAAPRLQYRAFTDDDLSVLGPWLLEAGLLVPSGVSREQLGRRLREDSHIVCRTALSERRRVVGFFRLDLAPDNTAELTLIVAPRSRRSGIGRHMIEAALAEARRLGLKGLVVVVQDGNHAALRLFADAGFEPAGRDLAGYAVLQRMVHRADHKPPIEVVP